MPKGPRGEWRPAETGPCAVHVMKIATGQIEETFEPPPDPVDDSRRASTRLRTAADTLKGYKDIVRHAGARYEMWRSDDGQRDPVRRTDGGP